MRHVIKQKHKGQAALIAVIFMLAILLSAVFGVAFLALKEARIASKSTGSRYSFYAAEAGVEDAVYRIKNNKNLPPIVLTSLNGSLATTTTTVISSSEKIIKSIGDYTGENRALSADIQTGATGVSFYYGIQVGDGGLTMSNNSTVNGSVFSDGNITGANGSIITSDAIVAGGIFDAPSVEWTSDDSDQFFGNSSSNKDMAQSFIANGSDRLNKVAVFINKVGNPSSNLTLHITVDNLGKPKNTDLANAIIPLSSVGSTPSWVSVSFNSPPNLISGTKYWIVLDYSASSASNYWNWRKDSSDGYPNNTGKYTSDWSSSSASWASVGGDLNFKVWIGGVMTGISGLTIGNSSSGSGRANQFTNTTIHGSSCPNQYCIINNPARQDLPIPDGVVANWKSEAAAGGVCAPPVCDLSGNFNLTNGSSKSLGPIKITGNLNLSNGSTLTVTGTIWVLGAINLSNDCIVKLSSSYGSLSGVLMSDGSIDVSNNCTFSGSGSTGSYIMALSAKNAPTSDIIEVSNNSLGVVYYAPHGRIDFANNAFAKEATAYGIDLSNNATITYESGLQNLNFSSGPGGTWQINSWQEIVP